jgi:hypothetical protein
MYILNVPCVKEHFMVWWLWTYWMVQSHLNKGAQISCKLLRSPPIDHIYYVPCVRDQVMVYSNEHTERSKGRRPLNRKCPIISTIVNIPIPYQKYKPLGFLCSDLPCMFHEIVLCGRKRKENKLYIYKEKIFKCWPKVTQMSDVAHGPLV